MSSHATLSAASQDRKARLAQLKSLKRKQSETHQESPEASVPPAPKSPRTSRSQSPSPVTNSYLSGRNYDPATRGPKLGFETLPHQNQKTLEQEAAALAEETRRQAQEEAREDRPLELFKIQPKKPNWDLKRDLARKMEVLNVRTDNANARLVRERIAGAQKKAVEESKDGSANGVGVQDSQGEGEAVGMEGVALVEAMHVREREEEEDARREREERDEMLDGT
ncbi:hypothetical protein LTR50_005161 [Elasticomyces elasticus]|nr:hypothetical protein LTR50_005161 [Elasticomyces elasticus]